MEIFDKFEIIGCYPALYIPKSKILVISDIHLGLESISSEKRHHVVGFQFKNIKKDLEDVLNKVEVEEIVINGDLMHMFSKSAGFVRKEINKILDFLKKKVKRIIINRGNHDGRLTYITGRDDTSLRDYIVRNNILITHGHRRFNVREDFDYIIIGHDHPVLLLRDGDGAEKKMPCFIYGECNSKKIIMLPAFSKLPGGCKINRIKYNEDRVFSPVMKDCDINEFKAIGVEKEEDLCLEFPKIGEID